MQISNDVAVDRLEIIIAHLGACHAPPALMDTRSAGLNGHGIHLVFWFGVTTARRVPPLPSGGATPATVQGLKALLEAHLAPEERAGINVVVDVSEPPKPKARKKVGTSAKPAQHARKTPCV